MKNGKDQSRIENQIWEKSKKSYAHICVENPNKNIVEN